MKIGEGINADLLLRHRQEGLGGHPGQRGTGEKECREVYRIRECFWGGAKRPIKREGEQW